MLEHQGEQLSQAALAELTTDHLGDGATDDDGALDSGAFAEPASVATALGSAVVKIATTFLQLPLREDAGVNQDAAGHIRMFFLQGVKWSPDIWDHWLEKHPKSAVKKPEWCAAFGSYCVQKAYDRAAQPLPARLSASASELCDHFTAVGRFLRREELFDAAGVLLLEAEVLPGAGDLVVFQGHVGILRELYADGSFITIEGNTYKGQPRHDGVYQCNRSAAQKKADGTFKLVGFCLLPSIDGLTPAGKSGASATSGATAA